MPTITTTGAEQVTNLYDEFGSNKVLSLTSVGGRTYYVESDKIDSLSNISIRTSEVDDAISDYTNGIVTVSDSSIYRVGERLEVYSSGTRSGVLKIVSIPTSTTLLIEVVGDDFTPLASDTIKIKKDSFFAEDSISILETEIKKCIKYKSESSAVELVVEILGEGVKKKS